MPHSVYLHIVYSNFLIDVRHNVQAGWSHLEKAKRLEPNLSYQFSLFARVQEHKQRAAGGGGGSGGAGSIDLVSYVEMQRNYRSLMAYHKSSLVAMRDFWRLVARDVVPMERLADGFKRIEHVQSMAERTYKLMLERCALWITDSTLNDTRDADSVVCYVHVQVQQSEGLSGVMCIHSPLTHARTTTTSDIQAMQSYCAVMVNFWSMSR